MKRRRALGGAWVRTPMFEQEKEKRGGLAFLALSVIVSIPLSFLNHILRDLRKSSRTYFLKWGNPANMGICVACFDRDIAGALGLHRAALVQYMRPEIIGFVLGSLIAAYLFKEFRPRAGSAPVGRFVPGVFPLAGGCSGRQPFLAGEEDGERG